MKKIMIAQTQKLITQALKSLLETDPAFEVVAEAKDGNDIIGQLKNLEVDILLLDMAMTDISGGLIDLTLARTPELKILILNFQSGTQRVRQVLKKGVRGIMTANHGRSEFLQAVHKISSGDIYIDPGIAESIFLESVTGSEREIHECLSPRELSVFRFLVEGFCVNAISEKLNISNKTVSAHKKSLMEKMHFSSLADLMRYAIKFEQDPERLRVSAERIIAHGRHASAPTFSADELPHELQVHQVELAMQNEHLRHSQLALEESRERYLDMFEFAPVAYLTLSRDGLITEINITGAKMLGANRKELIDRRFDRHVIPENRDYWNRQFIFAVQRMEKHCCELGLQRADGGVLYVHLDFQFRETVTAASMRVVFSDVTEFKHLEAPNREAVGGSVEVHGAQTNIDSVRYEHKKSQIRKH